jgi:hypothetical protein
MISSGTVRSVAILLVGAAALALAGAGEARADEAKADPLDGRWTLLQVTMTLTEVPMLGPMKTATTVVSVHDLVRDGDRLRGKGTLCDISIESERNLLTTTVSPRLQKILPVPELDAKLAEVDGKLTFFHANPTVVLGAKLRTIEDEPLPRDPLDHRVFDHERDGKYGITLRVKGIAEGDMYLVQRSWSRLDGWLGDDGTFGGIIRHGLHQSVLAATHSNLWDPPTNVPIPEGSLFRLGRLPQGGCPEAIAQVAVWFPSRVPPATPPPPPEPEDGAPAEPAPSPTP